MPTKKTPDARHHHDEERWTLVLSELRAIRRTQAVHTRALAALHTQGDALMAVSQEIVDAMAEVDAATTKVADEITVLIGRITTGMTPADVTAVATALKAKAATLTKIASDPENPVPTA
jgi:ABC-type transporter Mla subunit MlaD